MTRQELFINLMKRKVSDEVFNHHPLVEICPTCDDRGRYNLDFKTYECDCEMQKLLARRYYAANIGREYHDICLKDFDGPDKDIIVGTVTDYLERFIDNFHYGLGLTFNGPFGTGKTFAMTCVLKELIKQGEDVYFITFEDLINVWGSSWRDDEAKGLERKLKTVSVLGLDELRSDPRNSGGFLSNGLDSIIRHRTSNLLPTLITTNMRREEELDQFGKVYSLLAAKNSRVQMEGHDRRMKEVRDRTYDLNQRGERRPIC